jgi:Family of unknown function (DUF5681)
MKKKKAPEGYEVGYGKPPKKTQFQKGISGNPKGRPKKAPGFWDELLREARSLITISDNGKRIRISKHAGVMKQLLHKALTGNINATRIYLPLIEQAVEQAALSADPQPTDPAFEMYKQIMTADEEELDETIKTLMDEMEQRNRMRKTSDTE